MADGDRGTGMSPRAPTTNQDLKDVPPAAPRDADEQEETGPSEPSPRPISNADNEDSVSLRKRTVGVRFLREQGTGNACGRVRSQSSRAACEVAASR
jgi:hypothetical protein